MKTLWFAMTFMGLTIASSNPAASQNLEKKESKDIAAIKQLASDGDAAYNRHDAVAIGGLFLDDADFQWHTGNVLSNRKLIEQYFSESVFKNMPMEIRHTTTIKRIRFLRPDIAVMDGTIVISQDGAPENEKPLLSVLFTSVVQNKKGHWHIAGMRLMLPISQ
ncbi:MAG: SgcJ/EcaC family oxidoreductase [Bacteroidales bacterium]|nr:SgcJ/EcaC family oxidoreductase [Bacteroidales bacterium]